MLDDDNGDAETLQMFVEHDPLFEQMDGVGTYRLKILVFLCPIELLYRVKLTATTSGIRIASKTKYFFDFAFLVFDL